MVSALGRANRYLGQKIHDFGCQVINGDELREPTSNEERRFWSYAKEVEDFLGVEIERDPLLYQIETNSEGGHYAESGHIIALEDFSKHRSVHEVTHLLQAQEVPTISPMTPFRQIVPDNWKNKPEFFSEGFATWVENKLTEGEWEPMKLSSTGLGMAGEEAVTIKYNLGFNYFKGYELQEREQATIEEGLSSSRFYDQEEVLEVAERSPYSDKVNHESYFNRYTFP